MSPLLSVEHLALQLAQHDQPLLRDVSFTLAAGESLGLVGESGSGKSLTTRAIMRLLAPTTSVRGEIRYDGTDVVAMSRRELRNWRSSDVGMIFQDPRAHINPVRTVGDFLLEGWRGRFTDRLEAERSALRLLEDVGVGDGERRMRSYPHELSGGLLQRMMIASALMRQPRLLLADEPTTALDVTTQSDVMAIIDEQRRERGLAVLFISHDIDLAAAVCDRIAVMYAGSIVEERQAQDLLDAPAHPYTLGLMGSRPTLGVRGPLMTIPGRSISALEVSNGCSFQSRCHRFEDRCRTDEPALQAVLHGVAACHFAVGRDSGDASHDQ